MQEKKLCRGQKFFHFNIYYCECLVINTKNSRYFLISSFKMKYFVYNFLFEIQFEVFKRFFRLIFYVLINSFISWTYNLVLFSLYDVMFLCKGCSSNWIMKTNSGILLNITTTQFQLCHYLLNNISLYYKLWYNIQFCVCSISISNFS